MSTPLFDVIRAINKMVGQKKFTTSFAVELMAWRYTSKRVNNLLQQMVRIGYLEIKEKITVKTFGKEGNKEAMRIPLVSNVYRISDFGMEAIRQDQEVYPETKEYW